jgi:hypothetical protein
MTQNFEDIAKSKNCGIFFPPDEMGFPMRGIYISSNAIEKDLDKIIPLYPGPNENKEEPFFINIIDKTGCDFVGWTYKNDMKKYAQNDMKKCNINCLKNKFKDIVEDDYFNKALSKIEQDFAYYKCI